MPFRTLIPWLLVLALPAAADSSGDLAAFDVLLERYVLPEGVRYEAWVASPTDVNALHELVAALSAVEPMTLGDRERWAHYINLYNAFTLKLIVDAYPLDSIRDLGRGKLGFEIFYRDQLRLGAETLSLNALEKRLRKESDDPRVHFAVNCASRSCPPLMNRAWRGATLDADLEAMTRAYLAVPANLVLRTRSSVEIEISKIFKWYMQDFAGFPGGVRGFLATYAPARSAERIRTADRVTLLYPDYDWSLNAAR